MLPFSLSPFPPSPSGNLLDGHPSLQMLKGQLTAILLDPPLPKRNQELPAKVRLTSGCIFHCLKSPGATVCLFQEVL